MQGKIVLLIPAYRPTGALPDLMQAVRALDRQHTICHMVVVDDGSGPEFRRCFESLRAHESVTVLRHAVNLGKGAALKTGLNHALVAFPEMAGVVTADADGQHAAPDILKLARILAGSPERLVLGVRVFSTGVPLRSRFGNLLTRFIFRVFTGMQIADTQTGLRAWPRWSCEASLSIPINGYDFELECLLKAHECGALKIHQEPIKTIYLDGNRSSHFNPMRDSMRIYFVFLRYCGAATMAAIVDSLTFYTTISHTGNLVAGQVAGRVLATALAFVLARNLVFRSHTNVFTSLAKYMILVAFAGVISYSLLKFFHLHFGLPAILAKLLAEGLLFLANFSIQRQIVFVRNTAKEEI